MAEYIKLDAIMEYCQNQKDKTINCNDLARFPTADVIERSEYEKLRLVNLDLAETTKGLLAEHEQLLKLRSKIDKAVEEITQYGAIEKEIGNKEVANAILDVLKILKRNIGE